MRKAAIVTGIIFTSFILLGCVLRMLHLAGASILTVYGSMFFILVFQILLLIHQLKRKTAQLIKSAHVVGFFAGWTLIMGLVYQVQHWEGGKIQVQLGIGASALFFLLFFIGRSKNKANTPLFNIFTVLFSLVIISLLINERSSDTIKLTVDNTVQEYLKLFPAEKQLEEKLDVYLKDTTRHDLNDGAALAEQSNKLVEYIDKIKFTLVAEINNIDVEEVKNMPPEKYDHLENYDIVNHYMVGSDPQEPTGRGAELFYKLKKFKSETLADKISLDIDLSETIEKDGEKTTWVGDNFYHKTLAEALIVLHNLKMGILSAELKSFETKTFRK